MRRSPVARAVLPQIPTRIPELLGAAGAVIASQVAMRRDFYERNQVEVLQGEARFVGEHVIEVTSLAGGVRRVRGRHFVIATGSRPYRPPELDFGHPCIFDADTILRLDRTPHTLLIYGAGVVGCEYASMFKELGIKVNLVNTRAKLLEYLDDEIVDALAYHLRDQGVLVRHDEECAGVEAQGDHSVVMHLKSGKQIMWSRPPRARRSGGRSRAPPRRSRARAARGRARPPRRGSRSRPRG